MKNILMVGPSRKVHGGISAVVNNLYDAGLDQKVNLKYIGTMEEGSKFHKLTVALNAYSDFKKELDRADIIHVNVASDSSYFRKSFFIKAAHKAGKRIIIHQHGGNFEHFYSSLPDLCKKSIQRVLKMGDEFLVLSPMHKAFFEDKVGINQVKGYAQYYPCRSCIIKELR